MVCGLLLKTEKSDLKVFSIQSKMYDLEACYCATCDHLLHENQLAFKNLIDLKFILVDRNLWGK